MTIEKDAEDIIEKFSKILEDIPDSDETWYITDNLNLIKQCKKHFLYTNFTKYLHICH